MCVVFVFCVEKHIDISPGNNTLHDDNNLYSVLKVTWTLFGWLFCHCLSVDGIFLSKIILWINCLWMIHHNAGIVLLWPGKSAFGCNMNKKHLSWDGIKNLPSSHHKDILCKVGIANIHTKNVILYRVLCDFLLHITEYYHCICHCFSAVLIESLTKSCFQNYFVHRRVMWQQIPEAPFSGK